MVVQHNISAQNANEALRKNVSGLKKKTEKLSTGYKINRAADNAAGLAISEKMRSQVRGLTQASNNANDAISLIQTAEGGLQETEDIMQRMRELAVQSANGTYTDEDREQIQYEVDALKSEVDRISSSTEFNEMKLLDGSLDGGTGNASVYGAKYGEQIDVDTNNVLFKGTTISANIEGVKVNFTSGASGEGGENAAWDTAGMTLTINLVDGRTYSQSDIDYLVNGASTSKSDQIQPPKVKIKLANGMTKSIPVTGTTTTSGTVAGERATAKGNLNTFLVGGTSTSNTYGFADCIELVANNYGADDRIITIATDVGLNEEYVETTLADTDEHTKDGAFTLHIATGNVYTAEDIEKLLAKEGLDYSVKLTDNAAPDGDTWFYANTSTSVTLPQNSGGRGVGKDAMTFSGEGLTFQIGANGVEDQRLTVNVANMSAEALGISHASVATQDEANNSINLIDDAIKAVSTQRAKLGAVQNRLEHTVNSLNTANENLSAAESQIRDTDMAMEMTQYTKDNILQQASQSMLAQANQMPQGVLQLLG